jgi:transcriptional antiterminator NusG
MDWYSLFIITGKEEYIEEWLQVYLKDSLPTVKTLIPKRRLMERKAGEVRHVLKKMFPGYVLINTEMNPGVYHVLKKIPNLIRVLNTGEYFTKIPYEEMVCLLQLLGDRDVVDYSKVYLVNSRVTVKSGPLQGMEGLIKFVDKRKSRAKIGLQFMGIEKEFDVGIEVLDYNETIIQKK